MNIDNFDINSFGGTPAIYPLVPKNPKRVWLATYTLDPKVALFLHTRKSCDVRIVYAKTSYRTPIEQHLALFERDILVLNTNSHVKLWIIDDQFYVGSNNAVDDSIGDLMVRIRDVPQQVEIERLFNQLWTKRKVFKSTVIIK